ncbi:spore coat polysaccharide biosynthesis protein spsC [Candidatus Magnetobacterium bavaricum]|uniref:Spore coat polysaccharide biosynthesis protein spsC n=1 Tax=Candidatus Magnetobacterium bavaricum TaxID=29290 RepID=A0A0F3GJG3_9BACT|nr:spore coat polysaccharide biosynthesis protein spsC [Candidatus Magnetobacterium bavaricum]
MDKLAIFGGPPVRTKPFPRHITTGSEEKKIVNEVMDEGILSEFIGSNNEFFYGGKYVRAFEEKWAAQFGVKHVVSVNSATSGLFAAIGAAGVGPGDEVIVPPWTMTATATAILSFNAIPVFCDIDEETFCMSPSSVERLITHRTKALMPVHIYGHPADMDPIMELAKNNDLIVIEDAAQSPGGYYKGKLTGTIGHMGVFSFNCNKIIQCGEGGAVTTNSDDLAKRLQLIRNHGEAVIATGMEVKDMFNIIGWNYRMNEIEAGIMIAQMDKLNHLLEQRKELAEYISQRLKTIDGLLLPVIKENCTHTFYRYTIRLDQEKIKVPASVLARALNAEGIPFNADYIPLNLYPIYQKRIGYGNKGCPFTCMYYNGKPDYSMNNLPITGKMVQTSLSTEAIRPPQTFEDMDQIIEAFKKVFSQLKQLKSLGGSGYV